MATDGHRKHQWAKNKRVNLEVNNSTFTNNSIKLPVDFILELTPVYFGNDGGVMTFLPNALSKSSLMYSAAKDLSEFYWSIDSLDPEKLLVTRIEQCKLTFAFDDKTNKVNPAKYDLKCEKKYEP